MKRSMAGGSLKPDILYAAGEKHLSAADRDVNRALDSFVADVMRDHELLAAMLGGKCRITSGCFDILMRIGPAKVGGKSPDAIHPTARPWDRLATIKYRGKSIGRLTVAQAREAATAVMRDAIFIAELVRLAGDADDSSVIQDCVSVADVESAWEIAVATAD